MIPINDSIGKWQKRHDRRVFSGQMVLYYRQELGKAAKPGHLFLDFAPTAISQWSHKWHLCLPDEEERIRLYRADLSALNDYFLSLEGALTATMLPHLTALQGVIALQTSAGHALMYSGLVPDFVERLGKLADDEVSIFPFETIDAFHEQMKALTHHSTPALPAYFHDGVLKNTPAGKKERSADEH